MAAPNRYNAGTPVAGVTLVDASSGDPVGSVGNPLITASGSGGSGVTQGSTTAGQSGGLVQGAVTGSSPTYAAGTTNPLSLTTTGNMRVAAISSTGQTDGIGATPGFAIDMIGGTRPIAIGPYAYNGTTSDRFRTVQDTASSLTGLGMLATGGYGQYNTTLPTLTAGQYGVMQVSSTGRLIAGVGASQAGSDGQNNATGFGFSTPNGTISDIRSLNVWGNMFNGTTWDRLRSVQGQDGTGLGITAVSTAPNTSAGAGVNSGTSTVATGSLVVKAGPGNLYGICATNGASAGYLMIFDAVSAPADGVVTPRKVYVMAANSTIAFDFDVPLRFATGITMVFSTTGPFTKTASATAFLSGDFA